MTECLERVFESYGSTMSLSRQGKEISFRGFLRHFNPHTRENVEGRFSPLGEITRGRYVLLAPASTQLQEGDIVTLQNNSYMVRRTETVMLNDRQLYCWGLCVRRGEAEQW